MTPIDYGLVIVYLALILGLGLSRREGRSATAADIIVGGRTLTMPAFVASLVSTWYGGILGVGEYSYRFGVSNWLVFGLPYYLAALLFALFLARKARESELLTIPDRLAAAYGRGAALAGGSVIFLMTVPAAYVLMLGSLGFYLFGWPHWLGILLGSLFSVAYVYTGGFRSVVRTDIVQFGLMFLGFAVLLIVLLSRYGGVEFLREHLPETHFVWHGGNSGWYVAIWYVIALATLIEPSFYQRCYAAKSSRVARLGIFVSIGCWAVFDFLTTSCGLFARALMPDLNDPVGAYPALAAAELPPGLLGLFALALLATVMSTVDSYAFLAASTFSRDLIMRAGLVGEQSVRRWTRVGLVVAMALAIVPVLLFDSVVSIWHAFGSIGTPALLVPVVTGFVGRRRMPPRWALVSIIASGGLSLLWYLSQYIGDSEGYWLGTEPIFPGLLLSLALFAVSSRNTSP